ncbi:MAG: sugar-binding protein [Bacteroidota bacterium]
MKNYLLTTLFMFALAISAMGQTAGDTLVDFETVQDPFIEPFGLTDYENTVANPDETGNTSANVGKAVKNGDNPWGGINIYFGGDIQFTGSDDNISVDFYTTSTADNDSLTFTIELFNRHGGVETIAADSLYTDENDTEVGVWKRLTFSLPDTLDGYSYNQMVIFFGWDAVGDGEEVYFDNVEVPGYDPYGTTDVTFEITDKFNNAEDVKLFVDGTEKTLDQTDNLYTNTSSLESYNVTEGESQGIYEIVYSHIAMGEEVRDTTSVVVGNSTGTQTETQLIIVEEEEDGTADAINVGDTPPTIDGEVDAVWDSAKTHTMQQRGWFGSPTGLYSQWKIMWDIDNVYLLYMVEDETPHGENTTDLYMNDNVETFFDMNQSASADYDEDDWQIRTIRGSDIWSGSENVTDTWAEDVERAQTKMENNEGYIIEMAIPWGSLSGSFVPIDGAEFNYDCSAADVTEEGGTRDYIESWSTDEDIAYQNTSKFGTITLVEEEGDDDETGIQVPESLENIKMYPNPVKENLSLENLKNVKSVTIRNVLGAKIKEVAVNDERMNINVEGMNEGVYFVIFRDEKGQSNSLKLLKE